MLRISFPFHVASPQPSGDRLGSVLRGLVFCGALLVGGATAFASTSASADEALPELPTTVNVNTADAHTIAEVLTGVGLSRASAIVAYREQHGGFDSVEALANVRGVGERTLRLNAERILFTD